MDILHTRILCEFRSEKANTRVGSEEHTTYLQSVSNDKDVVIRGPILVHGSGNVTSYCTHIQENLKHPHYNCAYKYMDGQINVIQLLAIKANEELSIQ
jgi:hypothetical protein